MVAAEIGEKPSSSNNIFDVVPSGSNEYGIELDTTSADEEDKSILKHFQKIVKKFDCLRVETRGIERILPEDRNDSTTINTAMIWVRNLFRD